MKTVTLRDGSHRASVFETARLLCFVIWSFARLASNPYGAAPYLWWNAETGEDGLTGTPPFCNFGLCSCITVAWLCQIREFFCHCVGMTVGKRESGAREIERHWARPSAFSCMRSGWAVIWWNALAGPRVARPPASQIPLMLSWLTMLSWNNTTHGAAVRCWQALIEMSSPR